MDRSLMYSGSALYRCIGMLAGWEAHDVIVVNGVHVRRSQQRVQHAGKRAVEAGENDAGRRRQRRTEQEQQEEEGRGGEQSESARTKRSRRRSGVNCSGMNELFMQGRFDDSEDDFSDDAAGPSRPTKRLSACACTWPIGETLEHNARTQHSSHDHLPFFCELCRDGRE